MKKIISVFIITISMLPVFAQQDIFINVANIKGESFDAKHKEWIDASAFSGEASTTVSLGGAGGAGAGKASTRDFSFTICLDKSVNLLRAALYKGIRITSVNVEFVKPGATPFLYSKLLMEDVFVTSIAEGGTNAEGKNLVNISFSCTRYRSSYYVQNAGGAAVAPVVFGWDIAQNVAW